MKRLAVFISVVICVGAWAAPAAAQGTCTMQNLAGTYVFESKGSSALVSGLAPPAYPSHVMALYAPIEVIGRMTIAADGSVEDARYRRGGELAAKRICGSCHNPDYSGREQMPRIAGQREAYLFKAFKDYQAGVRVGTQAAMAEAVRGLDDAALADLAYYLARFRP